MTEDRGDTVSRWSRLKQRERQGRDKAKRAPGEIAEAPSEGGEMVPGHDPDQTAIVEQLPDIETLEEASDFTVFLKEGVPEALRRRALRKLWRLNPIFANLDGLNDYDEDFTIVTTLAENLKTVYQVGKGMPDPEPAVVQESDEAQAAEPDESVEVTPSSDEGEQAAATLEAEDSPESESKNEALASGEAPSTVDLQGPADEPEPALLRGGDDKPESSAARRRWAGFTS